MAVGIRNQESGIGKTSPPWPPRGGLLLLLGAPFCLAACRSSDALFPQELHGLKAERDVEGRIVLQVHGRGGLLGPAVLDGVSVTVRAQEGILAVGVTNAIGALSLSFRAATADRLVPPTSINLPVERRPWVTLRLEKDGFESQDLPMVPEDFAEWQGLRLLTRGVLLRRAA